MPPRNIAPVVLEAGDVEQLEAEEDDQIQLADAQIAVPEHSHVGESASNGLAERAVQAFENQFLTLRHALEIRMGGPIDIKHACMTWLVQHTTYILSKYLIGTDGLTGMGRLHGREVNERICEFGERILWYVPRRRRCKMDLKWR